MHYNSAWSEIPKNKILCFNRNRPQKLLPFKREIEIDRVNYFYMHGKISKIPKKNVIAYLQIEKKHIFSKQQGLSNLRLKVC